MLHNEDVVTPLKLECPSVLIFFLLVPSAYAACFIEASETAKLRGLF